jgi:hypothetical protein
MCHLRPYKILENREILLANALCALPLANGDDRVDITVSKKVC